MLIVPEALIAQLVSPEDAFAAVEATFAAMARGEAYNFPVVREALGEGRQYGFKSGLDRSGHMLGVKAGGYFPGNAAKGIINHQSTVFLFDPETGRPTAMVGGGLLTALRTAAASAISIDRLARKDAKVLGMVGAGHQAGFQLRAAARARRFDKVIAWNLHPDMLPKLGTIAAELGLPFEAVPLERMVEADVIITITSSPTASLMAAQVSPGTHLACMGTDTKGKQEVEAALLARATVFTDEVAQSARRNTPWPMDRSTPPASRPWAMCLRVRTRDAGRRRRSRCLTALASACKTLPSRRWQSSARLSVALGPGLRSEAQNP
jgi:alanine dehydrogenase